MGPFTCTMALRVHVSPASRDIHPKYVPPSSAYMVCPSLETVKLPMSLLRISLPKACQLLPPSVLRMKPMFWLRSLMFMPKVMKVGGLVGTTVITI